MWPFATGAVRYGDPVQAARGFAVEYLGFVHPVVGAFEAAGSRSGEVAIRPRHGGPTTIVTVGMLPPGSTWWVLGAASSNLDLQSPSRSASIASPVTLAGRSTAFEAVVNVEIRQDNTIRPLAEGVVMGGSMGESAPFLGVIRFPATTAGRGAIVLKTLSPKDGAVAEATVIRIRFADLGKVLERALNTGDLAPLQRHLGPAVGYAIAASGAYGTTSSDGAIERLSYLAADRGPWSFSLPAATLERFMRGSYRRFLLHATYFGVSPHGAFVALREDAAGLIDQIFMAIDTSLLE